MKSLFVSLLLAACGSGVAYPNPLAEAPTKLKGSYMSLEGGEVAIPEDRPVVLSVSSLTCYACNLEAKEWATGLRGKNPQNVTVITVMLEDELGDISQWKNQKGANWNVGSDINKALYQSYCPAHLVPCTMVQMPGKNLIRFVPGVVTKEQIEITTGKWE